MLSGELWHLQQVHGQVVEEGLITPAILGEGELLWVDMNGEVGFFKVAMKREGFPWTGQEPAR